MSMVTAFLQTFLNAGQDALQLIASAVLPVLFPFFVLTSLIINLSNTNNRAVVAVLSYFSGYPNGARLTQKLYQQNQISPQQAQNLAILTSTPSPMFVIATVGIIFLKDVKLGSVIFLCAVISAIINSLIWRHKDAPSIKAAPSHHAPINLLAAINEAFRSATTAIVNVSGVIIFFFILTKMCQLPPFITGMIEMTSGVAQTINPILIEFFISFGGLSVAIQNLIFAESYQVKLPTYLVYKFTHAILACGLLSLYLLFLN